ncbi:MAG TPA: hypothetical protein VLC06_22695 [Polyangia bacterium]|nr:hypothetical protein [Polyangia bacterium]
MGGAVSLPAAAGAVEATPGASDGGPGELEGPMHPAAQALYDRALKGFETHDYAAAVGDLEEGFALDPRREFLFAEAQAKRLGGDCRGAVVLYQRFLTTKPPALQIDATQIALARCAQELAKKPEVTIMTPPPAPRPPKPAPPRWSRDPWGLALTGAGVVALGIGIGYLVAAESARSDAEGAPTYAAYQSHWSIAGTRLDVAIGALAIGAALTASGVTRLALVRRHARNDFVAIWLGPGMIGGAF